MKGTMEGVVAPSWTSGSEKTEPRARSWKIWKTATRMSVFSQILAVSGCFWENVQKATKRCQVAGAGSLNTHGNAQESIGHDFLNRFCCSVPKKTMALLVANDHQRSQEGLCPLGILGGRLLLMKNQLDRGWFGWGKRMSWDATAPPLLPGVGGWLDYIGQEASYFGCENRPNMAVFGPFWPFLAVFSCIHGPILLSPRCFVLLVTRVSSWTRKRPPGRYITREAVFLVSMARFCCHHSALCCWCNESRPGHGSGHPAGISDGRCH